MYNVLEYSTVQVLHTPYSSIHDGIQVRTVRYCLEYCYIIRESYGFPAIASAAAVQPQLLIF
jgi:hypothetical protein